MGLQQMPDEIIDHIFRLISQIDQVSISRCCRSFNSIIEPILYSSFRQTGQSATSLLIATLLSKPTLAAYFRKVEVTKPDAENLPPRCNQLLNLAIPKEHRRELRKRTRQYRNIQEAKDFFDNDPWRSSVAVAHTTWPRGLASRENWDPVTAILLILLPNINKLVLHLLAPVGECVLAVLGIATKVQQSSDPQRAYSFATLEHVTIKNDSYRHNTLLRLKAIVPILELPSLQSFVLKGTGCHPLHHTVPNPIHVRRLYIPAPINSHLLTYCIALESLTLKAHAFFTHDYLEDIFLCMDHLHNHLKELTLLQSMETGGDKVPTMAKFTSLRTLDISGSSLNRMVRATELHDFGMSPLEEDLFPPSLEQLWLRDVSAVELLTHFIPRRCNKNEALLVSLKNLRRIHVEFLKGMENEFHFWPFVAWKYKKLGIEISFENGNSVGEGEGEVYLFTHDFEDLGEEIWKEEWIEKWPTGYDDERMAVERPRKIEDLLE